jgi:hypothetical protein
LTFISAIVAGVLAEHLSSAEKMTILEGEIDYR